MAASVFELILARVAAVLLAGSTAAGSNVFRARDDAFAATELPAINVRRASTSGENEDVHDVELHQVAFTVDCMARGAGWETAADALHMQAHALLLADATLAGLGRHLRCTGTDTQSDSADQPAGTLTASYEMQVFIHAASLSAAI
ncbi:MAG: hypothetical protein Q8S73_05370 [Deltaproteobacteria bacterium]|nr:hypothetical protein [Thiobacillus sp.]MDP3213511.1 hypothetical protein [Deltaproteobacteria bacterium]